MPVYLLTYHAYRSWMPDRPEGYVRRGQGILKRDEHMAAVYHRAARHHPVRFDIAQQWCLIEASAAVAEKRVWQFYEAAAVPTHLHVLVGWCGAETVASVSRSLKRTLGAALSRQAKRPGPWFSRGFSRKRVTAHAHFEHLRTIYIPGHGPVRFSALRNRNAE